MRRSLCCCCYGFRDGGRLTVEAAVQLPDGNNDDDDAGCLLLQLFVFRPSYRGEGFRRSLQRTVSSICCCGHDSLLGFVSKDLSQPRNRVDRTAPDASRHLRTHANDAGLRPRADWDMETSLVGYITGEGGVSPGLCRKRRSHRDAPSMSNFVPSECCSHTLATKKQNEIEKKKQQLFTRCDGYGSLNAYYSTSLPKKLSIRVYLFMSCSNAR